MTLPEPTPAGNYQPLTVARGDLPDGFQAAYHQSALVAWDIETSGLDWRRARIGTCQLFAEDVGVVVVGTDIDKKPTRLMALLEDPDIPIVFHHAPFDLRFMMHEWGVAPRNIRCTKVASKLIDPNAPNETHSLRSLLMRYLSIELAKGAVRTSDWTVRELSREQVEYAAADVVWLPALLNALNAQLEIRGLGSLFDECCKFLPIRTTLELGGYPDVFAY